MAAMLDRGEEMWDAAYDGKVAHMNELLDGGADIDWKGPVSS